jgi:hypothetical protein
MEGTVMQDELDTNLQSLFQERREDLPDEPFLGNMLELIERKRVRRVLVHRVVRILGICIIASLSPYLVKGSTLISVALNGSLSIIGSFMTSPRGIACAALCALLLFVFKRRWFSALI